jgi:hypothetical protein
MSDEKRKVDTLNPDGDRVDEISILKGERDALATRLAEAEARYARTLHIKEVLSETANKLGDRATASEARLLEANKLIAMAVMGRHFEGPSERTQWFYDLLNAYITRAGGLGLMQVTGDSAGAVQEKSTGETDYETR